MSLEFSKPMSQSFSFHLEQVCRRRRSRRVVACVCWAIAACLAIGLVLVGLDWLLGTIDPFGRAALTTVFAGSVAWIVNWCVCAIREGSETPLHVAQELEDQHPQLRDTLTNAWEFAKQSDEDLTAGSASLRRAVVLRATSAIDEIEWERMVPHQAVRRGLLALGAVVAVVSVLCWCLPDALATGVVRLVNPLNRTEWPRDYDLEFVEPPTVIAAGEDLKLQLRNTSGTLPSEVTICYRMLRQGGWHDEEQPVAAGGELLEIQRASVQQSLEYRAFGGDHTTMPWHPLKVVAPPRITNLTITVYPPDYSGLPKSEWIAGTPVFAGSRLHLQATVDQPISGAVLRGDSGQELVVTVDSEGMTLQLEKAQWRAEQSEQYQLLLTTHAGVKTTSKQQIALNVNIDQPPEVRFVEPTEDLTIVHTAIVPLRVAVQDELAIRQVRLAYKRSNRTQEDEQYITLWEAPPAAESTDDLRSVQTEYAFDLAKLSLASGDVVEIHAQATDKQPKSGQSVRPLRLSIVSEGQLWNEILQSQSQIVETLAQSLREQRELEDTTTGLSQFPDWSSSRWTSAVHGALFRQRQVASALGSGQQGVLTQLRKLFATIERNQLARPDDSERLLAACSAIQQLVEEPLIAVDDSMSEMLRQSRRQIDRDTLQPLIEQALLAQRTVSVGIDNVIDLLMPGNMIGRLERKLADLEITQKKLYRRCQDDVFEQMMQLKGDAQEQQVMLDGAVEQQRALAGRFASFAFELSQTASRLADDEPALAIRLAETSNRALALGTQSRMQSAADQLRRRQVGRATAAQQQTIGDLVTLRALLAGREVTSKRERLVQLRAAERELQRIRRQVSELERQVAQLSAKEKATESHQRELKRLQREREKLSERTELIQRRLERLSIPQAAKLTAEAAESLRRAKLDGETTKQARKKLETAQQALTTERRRQQVALARLQMAKLDAKLKSILGLQQAIVTEIARLELLRVQQREFTPAQKQSVSQLSDRQANVREEVSVQGEALESLPVFTYLLSQAAETMQVVEDQLLDEKLGQGTQDLANIAVQKLSQILESLQKEQQAVAEAKQEARGGGKGQESGDTPQAQTLQLALGQLKLLKSLQAALLEQTQSMEGAIATDKRPNHTASDLARRQRELVELAGQLVPEPEDPLAEELFPNLEQELEKSLDNLLLRELE